MILIITSRTDITADLVVLELQRRHLPYFRLNTEDFPASIDISWTANSPDIPFELRKGRDVLSLDTISSVWYRRPGTPNPSRVLTEIADIDFARRESQAYLQDLWPTLDCFWISQPERIRAAENKLLQLRLAHDCGLDVPSTVITNVPDVAKTFFKRHSRIIVKPLRSQIIAVGDTHAVVPFATLLSSENAEQLADLLRFAPVVVQNFVAKVFDLRVTVVGSRVFATEIHGNPGDGTAVDWRRARDISSLRHIPHHVPSCISTGVLALIRRLGLQFGALDFAVTSDNRYVFLELNPNGQWAWIEQLTGAPISGAIVDLLSGSGDPA